MTAASRIFYFPRFHQLVRRGGSGVDRVKTGVARMRSRGFDPGGTCLRYRVEFRATRRDGEKLFLGKICFGFFF